jgi:DNA processing protein
MDQNERELVRLHLTKGLGRARLLSLMKTFGGPRAILDADPRDWEIQANVSRKFAGQVPTTDNPEFCSRVDLLEQSATSIITYFDSHYPALLKTIADPPAILYLRGTMPEGPALAVVGARKASEPGRILTRKLCRELAEAGLTIISGLARGIDTAAHLGALAGEGRTVAVLGCGIDQIYPPENRKLAQEIADTGAILTEYPPGVEPLAGHFPARNRLISGLALGVLVIEAAAGSGSLITVDFALEQGRDVFSIPGGPLSPTSVGTNQLLKDGAHLVTEAADILNILYPGQTHGHLLPDQDAIPAELQEREKKLFKSLTFEPQHVDELSRKSALTPMEVSDILLHLELAGWVEQLPGARYLRSRNR